MFHLAAPGVFALALAAVVQLGTVTLSAQVSPVVAADALVPTLAAP